MAQSQKSGSRAEKSFSKKKQLMLPLNTNLVKKDLRRS
jgi:hypothetical protein